MKILIGTTNPSKVRYFETLLADADAVFVTPGELGIADDPQETGHTPEELGAIKAASASVPVFHSANMSLGVAVLCDLTRRAVRMFPDADIEITEAHHNRKLDAPSGTALMLADSVISERPESHLVYGRAGQAKREKNEIGIHALRMGSVVGEHTVYIATDTQILTLSHSAQSRSVFAEGALAAAEFIIGRAPGFYKMEAVLRG